MRMSNAIYAQYPTEIQDIIKQLYYTEFEKPFDCILVRTERKKRIAMLG